MGHLQTLVRKELIRPDRTDLPGEDAFRFRHLLIRDAAYEAMPKELRAELHARFAEWLEQIGAEHLAERDEIIGYHLEQAYRYRTELAPVDDEARELALRAGERLAAAARKAVRRSDVTATIGLTERALALLPDRHPQRGRLLSELGYSYRELGDLEAAQDSFERGPRRRDRDRRSRSSCADRGEDGRARQHAGRNDGRSPRRLRSRAEELERLGDQEGLAETLHLLGMHISWTDGDPRDALEKRSPDRA